MTIVDSFGTTIGVVLEASNATQSIAKALLRVLSKLLPLCSKLHRLPGCHSCVLWFCLSFVFPKQTLISANRNLSCTHSSTFYWVICTNAAPPTRPPLQRQIWKSTFLPDSFEEFCIDFVLAGVLRTYLAKSTAYTPKFWWCTKPK